MKIGIFGGSFNPPHKMHLNIVEELLNESIIRVEKIIESSKDRVEPICPISRQCGGCQLQHINYEKQLQYKENKVKDCIERIGGINDAIMEPILGMDKLYNYRNKAQYPVGLDKEENPVIGVFSNRSHEVIEI